MPMHSVTPEERPGSRIASVAGTLLGAVALAVLLRTFVIEVFIVPSGSMLETLRIDDRFVGEKVTLHSTSPKSGDIVTFLDPQGSHQILVKRVIATEGQTVDLRDGVVYVNGVALDEPYVNGRPSYELDSYEIVPISYPYTVPSGHIWVMGDNRTDSLDSRCFGAVPVDDVTSRAVAVIWPPQDARVL